MREADEPVRAREDECVVPERVRHGERGDEERGHRREHRDPHRALLGIDDARQPRIAAPRPPQHDQHEQRLEQPFPGRRLGHERGALGQREHEHEVEEELERRDALLLAPHCGEPPRASLRLHGSILAQRMLGRLRRRPGGWTSAVPVRREPEQDARDRTRDRRRGDAHDGDRRAARRRADLRAVVRGAGL
jgi:hypothetical protein